MSLIDDYFKYTNEYIGKYGPKTFVLLQKGDFYECYGYENDLNRMKNVADTLNIQLTRSNKKLEISKSNPYMMGIPIHKVHKYIRMLLDNNFIVVQVDQIIENEKIVRKVTNVYTSSNYIEGNQQPDANNIVSIYIEKENNKNHKYYLVGLSSIDLTTGSNNVYQIDGNNNDKKFIFDEVLKYLQVYYPKEVLLTGDLSEDEKDDIIRNLELIDKKLYYINKYDKIITRKTYQNHFLEKVFPKNNGLSVIENLDLENYDVGITSYIQLLDYVNRCRPILLGNMKVPEQNELFNKQKYMTLGNDSIVQLNLIEVQGQQYGNQSLFNIINQTSTPIGRRYLKKNLLNPLIDETIINKRYEAIEEIIKTNSSSKFVENLMKICDIERYQRKLETKMLNPYDFQSLVSSYDIIIKLDNILKSFPKVDIFGLGAKVKELKQFKQYYESKVEISLMTMNLNDYIEKSFFKRGIIVEIDKIDDEIKICNDFMTVLSKELAIYLPDKKDPLDDSCVIKVIETEKEYYLETTKKRAETIKTAIMKDNRKIKIGSYIINPNELEFDISTKSTIARIRTKYLRENSDRLKELIELLSKKIKEHYKLFLEEIYNKYDNLFTELVIFIGNIDFLVSGALVAKLYNYTKPIIQENRFIEDKSFINIKLMRHPIIERINTKTPYIPHDISLSDGEQDGILLYGLNSAGKTTIVRSIGLSIIMAQMGYYVPAKEMKYKPYHHIFTRISGSDNLYKNLSSFGVEMNELDTIMRKSGKHSLVLSDELCRGTETDSAMIIVLGMIEKLLKTKTNFISATHLHELSTIKRVTEKKNIGIYHIHIDYDDKNDSLIYTRELRKGSGLNFYGLLVAKHIIKDNDFLSFAEKIKDEIIGDNSLMRKKRSNYNKKVFMDSCQICGHQPKPNEIPLETHHIREQYLADENNMIEGNNKNEERNLVVLCNRCHDMTEKYICGIKLNIVGYLETSLGRQLKYEFNYIN